MLRSLLKDSAVYGIGILLSRLIGFLMIPIYTRVLTPADYGVIETIVRLVDVIGLILALGLASAFMRYFNEAAEGVDRRRLISTCMLLVTGATAVTMVAVIPASPLVTDLAFGHRENELFVRIALAGMFLATISNVPLTLLRAEGRPWRFTIISTAQLVLALILNLVLLVYLRMGVLGAVLSTLINAAVWSLILGADLLIRHGVAFDRRWARRLLVFGIPLVPASLSQFTLHFSDRFFLTRYATIEELGLYSLAYRFAMLATMLYGMLDTAWWPWAFRVAKEEDAPRNLADGVALMLVASTVFVTGVILFSKPVIEIMASAEFAGASRYVPPLTLAYWLFSTVAPISVGLQLAERTGVIAVANSVAAVVCLGLSFWIIPSHGVPGAILVTVTSFAVLATTIGISSTLAHPLPHRYGMIFVCVAVVGLSMIWEYTGTAESFWIDSGIRLGIYGALVALLGITFLRTSRPPTSLMGLVARFRQA